MAVKAKRLTVAMARKLFDKAELTPARFGTLNGTECILGIMAVGADNYRGKAVRQFGPQYADGLEWAWEQWSKSTLEANGTDTSKARFKIGFADGTRIRKALLGK